MLTVNLRKFRSLSAVYLKDHLPIMVTVDGFKMFLLSAYQDTAMDAIMALPVYDPELHPKGTPVRLYEAFGNKGQGHWVRFIAP